MLIREINPVLRRLIIQDRNGLLRELIGTKEPIVRDMPRHLLFQLNVSKELSVVTTSFNGGQFLLSHLFT